MSEEQNQDRLTPAHVISMSASMRALIMTIKMQIATNEFGDALSNLEILVNGTQAIDQVMLQLGLVTAEQVVEIRTLVLEQLSGKLEDKLRADLAARGINSKQTVTLTDDECGCVGCFTGIGHQENSDAGPVPDLSGEDWTRNLGISNL